jgi:hypothetical protein
LVGDGLRNVRFASAGFTDKERVLASGNKLQCSQLQTGLAWKLWIERPIEFGERELLFKARLFVPTLDEP